MGSQDRDFELWFCMVLVMVSGGSWEVLRGLGRVCLADREFFVGGGSGAQIGNVDKCVSANWLRSHRAWGRGRRLVMLMGWRVSAGWLR